MKISQVWLLKMADAENGCCISVGGLVMRSASMIIVCPRCHGDKSVADTVTETDEGVTVVVHRRKCLSCLGQGTIEADRKQIKTEGRRMKAARIKRNVNEYDEAQRYDVSVFDYSRFEEGKFVSDDVLRKLGARL